MKNAFSAMDIRGYVGILIVLLSNAVVAKRYCKMNSDCADLGDLECVKSICDWGVCSCPHGKAAKFLGSKKLFQCVTVKKVGEKCSNDGDSGVCGALNSYCNETTNKCRCDEDYVPIWGGERCAPQQSTAAGETCSNAIGICQLDDSQCTLTNSGYMHSQLRYGKPTCACANTQTLRVTRRDFFDFSGIMSFVPAITPGCYDKSVGDICLYDNDCMGNAECVSNRCACKSGYVKNYFGTECVKSLAKGAECTGSEVEAGEGCDGSLGLLCGDICYIDVDENDAAENTCKCGPFHTDSGSSCTMRTVGSDCYGDFNCKGISEIARCVDGECKAE